MTCIIGVIRILPNPLLSMKANTKSSCIRCNSPGELSRSTAEDHPITAMIVTTTINTVQPL